MKRPKAAPLSCPWDPVNLDLHEISAIKALPQSTLAVLDKLCGTDKLSFAAGGEEGRRASDFAEGKRWVALTLRSIKTMKLDSGPPKETGPHAIPKGPPPED